jgi:hypothetical protein
MRSVRYGLLVLATAGLLAGCGSGRVTPRGRLLNKGAPYLPGEGVSVHIAFFPVAGEEEPTGEAYVATFNHEDGTFQVVGRDGRGLPPGKYRVCIQAMNMKKKDLLKGRFAVRNTPIVREVAANNEELTVDLARSD